MGLGNTARAALLALLEYLGGRDVDVRLKRYKGQEDLFMERFSGYDNLHFSCVDTYDELVRGADVVISAVTYITDDVCADDCFDEGVLVVPVHTRGFTNCDLFFDKVYADDRGHVLNNSRISISLTSLPKSPRRHRAQVRHTYPRTRNPGFLCIAQKRSMNKSSCPLCSVAHQHRGPPDIQARRDLSAHRIAQTHDRDGSIIAFQKIDRMRSHSSRAHGECNNQHPSNQDIAVVRIKQISLLSSEGNLPDTW